MILKHTIIIALILMLSEVLFRLIYRLIHGHGYHVSIKFLWNRSHVTTHPFLSFAYKRNELIDKNQRLPYDIHYHKYFSFKNPLRINNMGHFGSHFSADKPPNVLRIACLGASTTANNIADENRDYSYPEILEQLLNEYFGKNGIKQKAEVYNCGIGGWVSVDILIDFQLNILHTHPDYIILYHGFNDLPLYLMKDFSPDYHHGRKNLGEVLPIIKRAYYLPKIKFWHLYEFLKDKTFGTGNIRNDILRLITKQEPDISRDFHHLEVEMNILKNILIVCKYYDIRIIVSSFVYYDYRNTPLTKKFSEGVKLENELLKSLAEEFDAVFVDAAELVPQNDDFFVDCVHFTPKGMELIAEHFGDAVISDLAKKNKCKEEMLLHG